MIVQLPRLKLSVHPFSRAGPGFVCNQCAAVVVVRCHLMIVLLWIQKLEVLIGHGGVLYYSHWHPVGSPTVTVTSGTGCASQGTNTVQSCRTARPSFYDPGGSSSPKCADLKSDSGSEHIVWSNKPLDFDFNIRLVTILLTMLLLSCREHSLIRDTLNHSC
jgi:hypothetical protein